MFCVAPWVWIATRPSADVLEVRDLAPFAQLDASVRELPVPSVRTVSGIAKSLAAVATTPLQKARAAYVWVTAHIAYSLDGQPDPSTVLGNLAGDCDAHSAVFAAICKALGVECATIGGSIRYAIPPGAALEPVSKRLGEGQWLVQHAWNAVRIDGRWGLIDTTMGSIPLTQKRGDAPIDDYFLASPAVLASDHVPDEARWSLAPAPTDLARSPLIRPLGWRLGIAGSDLLADARREESQVVLRPNISWRKGMRAALQTEAGSVPDRVLLQPAGQGTELRLCPQGPSSVVWLGLSVEGQWRPIVGYAVAGSVTGRLPKLMTRFYDTGASLAGPFDSPIPAGQPSEIRLRAPGAQLVMAFQGNSALKFVREGDLWVLRTAPFAGALEVMASYDDPRKFQALLTYDVK